MKNKNEIKNQLEVLKSLDKELDKYDEKIEELVTTDDLEESIRECEPKKRADIFWTAAYGVYTNTYLNLLLDGVDPEIHPIKKELERLKDYHKKLNEAYKNKNNKEDNKMDIEEQREKKKNYIYKKIKAQLNK